MFFSEANQAWRPVPQWVAFSLRLGYQWLSGVLGQRRIALISMPCDSAAAGLIALGALIRDLGSPNANDVEGHYDAQLRYARQYLESCRDCNMRCHPELKGCSYTEEASGRVRDKRGKLYQISERTDFVERSLWVCLPRKSLTRWQNPKYATDWRIDGEPPLQLINPEGALPGEAYIRIIDDAQIIPDNLRRSFSGLCLAGRLVGETATREACASVRFRFENGEHRLPDLLTIYGWSQSDFVSRITFFNARTERFDRQASAPDLVVADGDTSFLKVLSRSEFQRSDVIGVIHRTVDRDHLEDVGNKMLGLRQWYDEDSEMLGRLPAAPRGISLLILRRRTS